MNPRDRELVRRMLTGDETAFDTFFAESFPPLYRFALARMSHDADGAEEVAQETLCKAISKLSTYRGEAALLTWLCTFCRHQISAYYERLHRQPSVVPLVEPDAEVTAALESLSVLAGIGPEDALHKSDVSRLVHNALDRLPARYADALEWKYVDGLSVKEIAARLRLTAKAAESLLTRARAAFRDGFRTLAESQ